MGFEDRYKPLLAGRVPREEITIGRAYVIHARNGGVGIAVDEAGRLGYQLHREKFGNRYLFVEYDWDSRDDRRCMDDWPWDSLAPCHR